MDHVYKYFESKREQFKRLSSGLVTDRELDEMFQSAPDGQTGLIDAVLPLDDTAYISVFERVELESGLPKRRRYAYFLIADATEIRGYERDPTHDPVHHRHLEDHQSEPWEEVSLEEAAEDFWDLLTQIRTAQP